MLTKDYLKKVDRLLYSLAYKYCEYVRKSYPTHVSWDQTVSEYVTLDDIGYVCKEAFKQGVSKERFVDELKELLEKEGVLYDGNLLSECDNAIEQAGIQLDWEKALKEKKRDEITRIIQYAFSDEDIANLAKIHKKSGKRIRHKIESLLECCNFHGECANFILGRYDEYSTEL